MESNDLIAVYPKPKVPSEYLRRVAIVTFLNDLYQLKDEVFE